MCFITFIYRRTSFLDILHDETGNPRTETDPSSCCDTNGDIRTIRVANINLIFIPICKSRTNPEDKQRIWSPKKTQTFVSKQIFYCAWKLSVIRKSPADGLCLRTLSMIPISFINPQTFLKPQAALKSFNNYKDRKDPFVLLKVII